MKYILTTILLGFIPFVAGLGCSVYWTDHVFIATVGKEFKAGEVVLIADANELYIGVEEPEISTDKITVVTPAVVIKSE